MKRGPHAPRTPFVVPDDGASPARLWSLLFVSRHVVIVALAIGAFTLRDFGDDRTLIGALLLGAVLPYDLAVHWYTRRSGRPPISMPLLYAPVPALFVLGFPATWVPALLAALGNTTLFALTADRKIAVASAAVSIGAFAAVVPSADPDMATLGLLGYALVTPAVVLGVTALVQGFNAREARFLDHVQHANDLFYAHDIEGVFTEVNEAALALTGYSRDELGRVNVSDIVAPEYLEEVAERMKRALAGDEPTTPWELEIVTKDGRRVPVEINSRVVYGRRGQPVAVQGIARDISERRHVEAQRAALDQARTQFIANAAHELRTPLTTLAGLASVLASTRERLDDEELEGALEALARQGRRAQLLADRLLDLSAIELGQVGPEVEPVSVRATVERVLEGTPPPPDTRVSVAVDEPLSVMADAIQLEQVLRNLIVNAYRYGGSSVEVCAGREGDLVRVSVEDDGPGVPPELAPHVFEPFTRGDHGGRPDSTGLGLAISVRILEALGGSISYEDREPTGARFVMRIPAAP